MIYVGLDLHKKTIQIAAVDYRGATLLNKKIRNTHASLEMEISRMPKGSKYVIVEWTPLKENTFRMILHRTRSLI